MEGEIRNGEPCLLEDTHNIEMTKKTKILLVNALVLYL